MAMYIGGWVIIKFIDRWNSSVTHDIAKIDNYSVYRRLGNNFDYTTNRHEITVYYLISK